MRLENRFRVPVAADVAWTVLNDVPRVIPCMPGAQLDEVVAEGAWKVTVHVKLGPIALQFRTDIERVEADEAGRRVVLLAKAQEARGRGGAEARIESSLADVEGGAEVTIVTDLELQGTVAQYGRGGIVADVSAQLTRQFAECVAAEVVAGETPASAGARAEAPAVAPIGGVRLTLVALRRRLAALVQRRPGPGE